MQRLADQLESSLRAAEQVSDHLALYDTAAARALISSDSGNELPPRLRKALEMLLGNLERYKPYLPDFAEATAASKRLSCSDTVAMETDADAGVPGVILPVPALQVREESQPQTVTRADIESTHHSVDDAANDKMY
eukprot:gene4035-1723_t